MGIEQHVATHVEQLPFLYFIQELGFSLSTLGVAFDKG